MGDEKLCPSFFLAIPSGKAKQGNETMDQKELVLPQARKH